MIKIKMFCITTQDEHYNKIKNLDYIPVGLGKNINSKYFLRDNTFENISEKNSYYGEYTFHYWLWKNEIQNLENWIGFCQYRKFWILKKVKENIKSLNHLNENILKEIPAELDNFDTILGEPFFVNQFRLTKFVKKNFNTMIKNPLLFFDKDKRNIKFHFDMMHGKDNLYKAIELLDSKEKNDFYNFVNTEVSFNPHNMFICKSKKILKNYYDSVFPWLRKCEEKFGFELEGYGLKRIYGFLAERYLSFWFKKYTKFTTLPILFKDISTLE